MPYDGDHILNHMRDDVILLNTECSQTMRLDPHSSVTFEGMIQGDIRFFKETTISSTIRLPTSRTL